MMIFPKRKILRVGLLILAIQSGWIVPPEICFGQKLQNVLKHKDCVSEVCFSPDGKILASCGGKRLNQTNNNFGEIKLWDVEKASLLKTFKGHKGGTYSICFSPDGKHLASVGLDKTIKIWDVTTGKVKVKLPTKRSSDVGSLQFRPDGKVLATSEENSIKLWDTKTWKSVSVLKNAGNFFVFFSNGLFIVTYNGGRILIWDSTKMTLFATLEDPSILLFGTYRCTSVDVSKNGRFIITPFQNLFQQFGFVPPEVLYTEVMLFDVKAKTWIARFNAESNLVLCVRFCPNGNRFAAGTNNNTICIWNLNPLRKNTLRGHTGPVNSIDFSPDGRLLASGSGDGTVRLWKMPKKAGD